MSTFLRGNYFNYPLYSRKHIMAQLLNLRSNCPCSVRGQKNYFSLWPLEILLDLRKLSALSVKCDLGIFFKYTRDTKRKQSLFLLKNSSQLSLQTILRTRRISSKLRYPVFPSSWNSRKHGEKTSWQDIFETNLQIWLWSNLGKNNFPWAHLLIWSWNCLKLVRNALSYKKQQSTEMYNPPLNFITQTKDKRIKFDVLRSSLFMISLETSF